MREKRAPRPVVRCQTRYQPWRGPRRGRQRRPSRGCAASCERDRDHDSSKLLFSDILVCSQLDSYEKVPILTKSSSTPDGLAGKVRGALSHET